MANRYNQRITADIVPMEFEEEDDEDTILPHVPSLKRNLLSDFGRPSVLEPPIPHEHMKVYLRIRPFSKDELERKEDQQCLTVESDRTVVTHAPKDSHFFKNMSRGLCRTATRFTFSHIFNENTSQKDFFSSTMLGLVKDFIDGQNCLVFSYGVTSSGKTYTIQGNPRDAGVLPRALDVLFNSISRRQWDGMDLKPKMFVDVTRLTPEQEMMERKVKERVMKLSCDADMDVMSLLGDDASDISMATNVTTCSESSNISTVDGKDSLDGNDRIFEEIETRVREEGIVSVDEQGQVKFSVWVSFAEIYNEQIYDLLEPVPPKKKNYKRPCLKLSDDKNGSPYIKGLKYIQVNSADEAYKLLTIGQRNLQTACTKLNHNSSRSHCIFNIKIIRVMDKDNPHAARVSMLTLCDLAGSERYGKTQTSGDRLKEAGNINTSLLTLGRCIETLRHNQAHKENKKIVPFRESKLTRLLQNFFVGQGKAAMVVNVNQMASMFDETMHVFKFSAIASKVEVQQKPVFIKPKLPVAPAPAQIPRTSISWATPARNGTLKQNVAENVPLPEDSDLEEEEEEEQQVYTQENIDELCGVIEQLQADLENEIESRYRREKMIREEVCNEMMKQFSEIEEQYSERIRLREQRAEELAEKRIRIVLDAERAKRKEVLNDGEEEWVSSVLLHREKVKVEKRDATIKELREEIEALKSEKENESESELEELIEKVDNYESRIKELEEQLNEERAKSEKLDEMVKKVSMYEEKFKSLEEELAKREESNKVESSEADLVENLTQQLQQARQQIKDQENEMVELNDMLTEAGETFEQKQSEISKLKDLTQEYEKRMETQAEAIKVLERAASDSKVAMETADQSLSKREACVSTLQEQIRELEGDVNKYRNKARFFEEQVVEKEQEAYQWKMKYEKDLNDHASSQEALIHGFNAEISNLKSQIFHFKSQLYGIKSPIKSPGGTLKSPDVKLRLFPMSPLNSSGTEKDLNSSMSSHSPLKDKDTLKNTVNGQGKALQNEMDKNCRMITDLEHALQMSRGTVEDLEKRLIAESEKCSRAGKRIEDLESKLKNKDIEKCQGGADETKEGSDNNEILLEKEIEVKQLEEKVKELEPLMKDYFSTTKKLKDSEIKVKELNDKIEEKDEKITNFEESIRALESDISDLKNKLREKEIANEKLEEKYEEMEVLNCELKGMVDKTATDLEIKEKELEVLSPKADKTNKGLENGKCVDNLKKEVTEKLKDIEDLRLKLSNMKTAYKVKDAALQEATEKGNDYEFKNNELTFENQELQKQVKECKIKIEDLQYELEKNLKEVQTTGEELAVKSVEAEKSKRMIEELKASVCDLESAVADKEVELCEKDKVIEDKNKKNLETQEQNNFEKNVEKFTEENLQLREELQNLKINFDEVTKEKDLRGSELEEIKRDMSGINIAKKQLEDKVNELEQELSSLREELNERETLLEEVKGRMNEIRTETLEYQAKDEHLDDKLIVMEKRVEELVGKSSEKDAAIQQSQEKISKLKLQLLEKENENTALLESFEELKAKNEEANNSRLSEAMLEIAELKSAVHTHKALHHKVKGELEEALLTVENSRGEMDCVRKQLSSVKESESQLKLRVEELENELKCNLDDRKELNSVKESETQLKLRVEELENELKCNLDDRKELNSVKESETQLKLRVEELENELKCNLDDRKELNSVKESETQLKLRVEELENELKCNHDDLENKSVARIKEIENELQCAERVVSEMKELLKRRDEQIEELHSSLRNANKNVEKISKDVRNKDEQIATIEKEKLEKESAIECLQNKLSDTEQQLSFKTDEVKSKEETYSEKNCHIKKLNDQIMALEEEKKSAEKELSSKIKMMESENSKLRYELSETCKASEKRDIYFKDLTARLEQLEKTNSEMKSEIIESKKLKDAENELKSQLTLKEVECETLNLELKVLKDDLAKETQKYETAKEQLEGIKKLSGEDSDTEVSNKSSECDNNEKLVKMEEIQRLYEAEKMKNEEYKKIISETGEMSCSSPVTGVRQLRKDKIELENSLMEAKYKISSLETKVKDLGEKLKNAMNEKLEPVPSHDPLLQRKLNSVTAKLQETENTNRSLIKEITQLQSLAERLEQELKEEQERKDVPVEKDIHRRSRASILQADTRMSISSPSTKMELAKTREREQCLKEQLTEANSKIQEWLGKLSETENKLQVKTQELKHAKETIQQLEVRNSQEGRNTDRQIDEYMEQNNNLKLQILKKEGELECCQRSLQDLQRQLDSELGLMKTFEKDKKSQEEMITLLKETLEEQENMLQEQEDFLSSKEAELQTCQTEHRELLDKYQALLESRGSKQDTSVNMEVDQLKKQLAGLEDKLENSDTEKDKILMELKEKRSIVMETEKKLHKAVMEKEKLQSVIKENNQELKAMECSLTEARKEIEELKSHGADKMSAVHLEEMRREADKSAQDLQAKIRSLQCHNKELNFKLSASEEKVKSLTEERLGLEHKLKDFREERDKLVSGLEAVLKKKDTEIKQHKDMIKQLKEKEIQITKNWQEEREQIAAGLQDLNKQAFTVKSEPPGTPCSPPREEIVKHREDTPLTRTTPTRQSSRGRPQRPSPPKLWSLEEVPDHHITKIETLSSSPGSSRRASHATPGSETSTSNQNSARGKRGSSRRGKKRPSSEGLENLPPLPKRRSKDDFGETSNVSESDDYSSHLQVDATPPVAAKTLRRTRKKNGSQLDISKVEETDTAPRRSTRNKRTAKHRLLESFRESPMGRTSKRILDSIAETFSPKSPTRSPTKSPLKEDNSGNYSAKGNKLGSRENVCSESQETEKKRGRGRHKLYKEDTYISEPFESTGDFVQSPEDVHKSVTRSLRSRRH